MQIGIGGLENNDDESIPCRKRKPIPPKAKKTSHTFKDDDNHDTGIHNYSRKVECKKKNLEKIEQGDIAISFLEKLHLYGLADGRIIVYGDRLSLILKLFNSRKIRLLTQRQNVKRFCLEYWLQNPTKENLTVVKANSPPEVLISASFRF